HYLREVIDPLGRTGARTEYDEQGRLVRLANGVGSVVQFTHDIGNSRETIIDARGNATDYEYDNRGNVVTEVNALGGVTRRTYDAQGHQTSVMYVNGATYTSEHDAAGNEVRKVGPLGRETLRTFDANGNELTETVFRTANGTREALVTSATYDADGQLLSSTN